jgi:hypothetical protein
MTIQECVKLRQTNKDFDNTYKKNRYRAWKSWRCLIEIMRLIRPGSPMILHHRNIGCDDYELFNDVIPMFKDEHQKLHVELRIGKKASQETLKKMSLARLGSGKYGIIRGDSKAYHKAAYHSMSYEQRQITLAKNREHTAKRRSVPGQRDVENQRARERRANESAERREKRLARRKELRALESPEKRSKRLAYNREYDRKRRKVVL